MREHISIRLNDHQQVNGIQEYTVEIAIPGKYHKMIVGVSQADLINEMADALGRIFTSLGIPEVVVIPPPVIETLDAAPIFRDSQGNVLPVHGFGASAKASFGGEVIRNGRVLTDEETQPPALDD